MDTTSKTEWKCFRLHTFLLNIFSVIILCDLYKFYFTFTLLNLLFGLCSRSHIYSLRIMLIINFTPPLCEGKKSNEYIIWMKIYPWCLIFALSSVCLSLMNFTHTKVIWFFVCIFIYIKQKRIKTLHYWLEHKSHWHSRKILCTKIM